MAAPTKNAVGDGATVSYATDSVFTTILGIKDITAPKYASPEVDTTAINAAADTSQAGRVKASDVTLTLQFNLTQSTALMALQLAQTQLNWKVALDDNGAAFSNSTADSTITFVGWIKEYDPFSTINQNKEVESKLVIQPSGTLSLASA